MLPPNKTKESINRYLSEGKKKRNKNKKRSRLTPVGGISLNSQLVRGVIGIATKKAELVEYFLRLGIHVVTEVLHANNKENVLYDHSKSAPLLRLHTADRLETPHIEFWFINYGIRNANRHLNKFATIPIQNEILFFCSLIFSQSLDLGGKTPKLKFFLLQIMHFLDTRSTCLLKKNGWKRSWERNKWWVETKCFNIEIPELVTSG